MDEFQALAIKTSVDQLFTKNYFDICTFDRIAKLTKKTIDHKIYSQLSAFHCVHYSDMEDRTKELLQQKVVECLRGDAILNPARVLQQITDEGNDFTFTEDRYIDDVTSPSRKSAQKKPPLLAWFNDKKGFSKS